MDMALGQHETDSALEAYLDPEGFKKKKNSLYRPLRKAAIKFYILPNAAPADSTPAISIDLKLKSFHCGVFDRAGREQILAKTKDLDTADGMLYLIHDDEKVVQNDLETLHLIKMKYQRFLYDSLRIECENSSKIYDLAGIMQAIDFHGATLIFFDTQTEVKGAVVVDAKGLDDSYDGFDQGIIDLRKETSFMDTENLL